MVGFLNPPYSKENGHKELRFVEKAISNLQSKKAHCLKNSQHGGNDLRVLIRPSGFYRQKAARLKVFARYVFRNYGSLERLFAQDAAGLRMELFSLDGIGMKLLT